MKRKSKNICIESQWLAMYIHGNFPSRFHNYYSYFQMCLCISIREYVRPSIHLPVHPYVNHLKVDFLRNVISRLRYHSKASGTVIYVTLGQIRDTYTSRFPEHIWCFNAFISDVWTLEFCFYLINHTSTVLHNAFFS